MAVTQTLQPSVPPTTTPPPGVPPSSSLPPPPPSHHRPLPRCAVVNFSREGDSVRWAPRLASTHDRVCGGLVVRGTGVGARVGCPGVNTGNGGERMRALLEDPFRLEELSSRALKFMKDGGKSKSKGKRWAATGWGGGGRTSSAATVDLWEKSQAALVEKSGEKVESGKRSPTKVSETGLEDEEQRKSSMKKKDQDVGVGKIVMDKEKPKKGKGNYSHLQAISPRKSSAVSTRGRKTTNVSQKNVEEPSLFARMFAKAKRKSGGSRKDDVFDDDELKELKMRLRKSSRMGTRSSTASKERTKRISKAGSKAKTAVSEQKALILHPTAARSRRRWFLRSSRTQKDKQLIMYQPSFRTPETGKRHGFKLRRLPRIFKKRRPRFADQQQRASDHNTSRRLIPNVSMYDDDFVAFMTSAAAKRGTQV